MKLTLRPLKKSDYNKGYLSLLRQLTKVGEISKKEFDLAVDQMDNVLVLVDKGYIVGTGTLLVEQKIIHQCGKVGHIEDIVIDKEYRGQGLGKCLIKRLIRLAKDKDCYKVILNCDPKLREFYQGLGFEQELGMKIYVYQ